MSLKAPASTRMKRTRGRRVSSADGSNPRASARSKSGNAGDGAVGLAMRARAFYERGEEAEKIRARPPRPPPRAGREVVPTRLSQRGTRARRARKGIVSRAGARHGSRASFVSRLLASRPRQRARVSVLRRRAWRRVRSAPSPRVPAPVAPLWSRSVRVRELTGAGALETTQVAAPQTVAGAQAKRARRACVGPSALRLRIRLATSHRPARPAHAYTLPESGQIAPLFGIIRN